MSITKNAPHANVDGTADVTTTTKTAEKHVTPSEAGKAVSPQPGQPGAAPNRVAQPLATGLTVGAGQKG